MRLIFDNGYLKRTVTKAHIYTYRGISIATYDFLCDNLDQYKDSLSYLKVPPSDESFVQSHYLAKEWLLASK